MLIDAHLLMPCSKMRNKQPKMQQEEKIETKALLDEIGTIGDEMITSLLISVNNLNLF
jgi:hypothetical protein